MSKKSTTKPATKDGSPRCAVAPCSAFRLCIFGSRTLWDDRVHALIHAEIEKHRPTLILTAAEAGGVCREARIIAKARAIPLKVYFLNFVKHCAGAYENRSEDILRDADHVVLIHDGVSKGTSNELEIAKRMNVPFTYHVLTVEEHQDTRPREQQCILF